MDEKGFEIAEAITTALVDNGVKKVQAQVRPRDPLFDGECIECTEPIPEARLNTGAQTCLECQEVLEKIQAQYRR
jgi:RNA polymerase-binding transcription factor DksA